LFGELLSDSEIALEFGADAFTRHMLEFELAWTRALGQCGIVPVDDAEAAEDAIMAFAIPDLGESSNRDGIPVPALVSAIRQGLPEGVAHAIHSGATSQDVIDTAMVLSCLSAVDILSQRIGSVLEAMEEVLERFGDRPLMARTRMQASLPATVALRIEAWKRPLEDHLARADKVRSALQVVQIGGAIGIRENPNKHIEDCAETLAEILGLKLGPVWHTDRSRMVEFGNWMMLVAGTLGKMGQDIALMSQQGVDKIALRGGGGSSAMPHKQNPVASEIMTTLARYASGQQAILGQAMIHEQERSGAAWALEWLTLPAMAEAVGASLRHAKTLMTSVECMGMAEPRA
jgi:3-carboxy-cis,cis-muconate cycloisomerase